MKSVLKCSSQIKFVAAVKWPMKSHYDGKILSGLHFCGKGNRRFSIVTSDLSISIAFVSQQINSDIALLLKMFGSFRGKVETASRKTDMSAG